MAELPAKLPPRVKRVARDALEPRELAFVVAYCDSFKIQRAAIEAGFPPKGAHVQANRLLKRDTIQSALREEMDDRLRDTRVNVDRVLHEIAIMAFADIGDYLRFDADGNFHHDFSGLPRGATRAIQEITIDTYMEGKGENAREVKKTKLRLYPKTQALEMLGKYLKMFVERHEHSGPGGGPIELDVELTTAQREEIEAEVLKNLDFIDDGSPRVVEAEFEEVGGGGA